MHGQHQILIARAKQHLHAVIDAIGKHYSARNVFAQGHDVLDDYPIPEGVHEPYLAARFYPSMSLEKNFFVEVYPSILLEAVHVRQHVTPSSYHILPWRPIITSHRHIVSADEFSIAYSLKKGVDADALKELYTSIDAFLAAHAIDSSCLAE